METISYKKIFTSSNPKTIISFFIIIFLGLCFAYLKHIGLNYDETHFVNAALGGITNDFIYKRIAGIPVFVAPYVGALKSFMYAPIFKIFGVNLYSIRIPAIIMSAITILIWYRASLILFKDNIFYSLFFLLLLVTDTAFINLSSVDEGPIVLQNLFAALIAYCYLLFLKKKSSTYFILILLAMLLGLYNKLNFIWFINAFSITILIFNRREFITFLKSNIVAFWSLGITFSSIVTATVFLIVPCYINIPMGMAVYAPFLDKILFISKVYLSTLNGSVNYSELFGNDIPIASYTNIIELSVFILWLLRWSILQFYIRKNSARLEYDREITFFLVLFILIFLQISITPQARAPHHIIMLWPFQHLIFLLTLNSLLNMFSFNSLNKILKILPCTLVISQMYVNYEYINAFNNPNLPLLELWTQASFKLSNFINQHLQSYDEILCIDFGINNQIYALAPDNQARRKFHDLWWLFFDDNQILKQIRKSFYPQFDVSDNENKKMLYENYFKNKNVLIIKYAGREGVPHIGENFLFFTYQYSITTKKITEIADANGNLIYSVFVASQHQGNQKQSAH